MDRPLSGTSSFTASTVDSRQFAHPPQLVDSYLRWQHCEKDVFQGIGRTWLAVKALAALTIATWGQPVEPE